MFVCDLCFGQRNRHRNAILCFERSAKLSKKKSKEQRDNIFVQKRGRDTVASVCSILNRETVSAYIQFNKL